MRSGSNEAKGDSKTKTKIVLEGLSGRPVSEICSPYGIHQTQYS
jgi:hypothetical protein